MNLDERLREILETHRSATPHPYATKIWLNEIKEAFAAEGYVQIPTATKEQNGFIRINPEGMYMTGGYWYDRFEKELHKFKGIDTLTSLEDAMIAIREREAWAEEAAKKASGLE